MVAPVRPRVQDGDEAEFLLEYYSELFPLPVEGIADVGFDTCNTAVLYGWNVASFDYQRWSDDGLVYLGVGRELYAARPT